MTVWLTATQDTGIWRWRALAISRRSVWCPIQMSLFKFCRCLIQMMPHSNYAVATQISTWCTRNWLLECGWLNRQSGFCVNRVCPCTYSGPPDNPCPIRFLWRSVTHIGISVQWLRSRPGGDGIGSPVQLSSPQPAAIGAQQYQPIHVFWLDRTRALEVILNTPPDGLVGVILSTVGVTCDVP